MLYQNDNLAMTQTACISRIREHNTCGGRKEFVFDIENTQGQNTFAILPQAYMEPYDQIQFASLKVNDVVQVRQTRSVTDSRIQCEIIGFDHDASTRLAVCSCHSYLVGDGFHIYCPNPECGMTRHARIERLATTSFFSAANVHRDFSDEYFDPHRQNRSQPFNLLLNPRIWGMGNQPVVSYLLKDTVGEIDLSTFLVENNIVEFITQSGSEMLIGDMLMQVRDYFGYVQVIRQRRDRDSQEQQEFIKAFLWSLGLESLRPDIIHQMVERDERYDFDIDTFYPYAWYLTKPWQLAVDFNLHPRDINVLAREVIARRFELAAIFNAYLQPDSYTDTFGSIIT